MPFLPPNQQRQSTEGKLLTEKLKNLYSKVTFIPFLQSIDPYIKKGKGSPYSITERRVPNPNPVRGNQPAGDVSHKPGGRLPLLFTRPVVILTTLKRADTNFAAW